MKTWHPRKNDQGQAVELTQPHQATEQTTWGNPTQWATATPGSPMPTRVAGRSIETWFDAPTSHAGWEQLTKSLQFDEPAMPAVPGMKPASGAVVIEADGRVWVVSPSNRFAGYKNTFPKGRMEAGMSLRATALKEVFEESGLQVVLSGFLCDSIRSATVTRYYLARRLGGNPADMGWESQAVHLVPVALLAALVAHPNDQAILMQLQAQGAS